MKSTHNAGVNERVLKVGIALQQLVAEEGRVSELGVECDVDR